MGICCFNEDKDKDKDKDKDNDKNKKMILSLITVLSKTEANTTNEWPPHQ